MSTDDITAVEKFDYWQRRMKAEALEEAADALNGMMRNEAITGGDHGYEDAIDEPERWLLERAQGLMDGSIS